MSYLGDFPTGATVYVYFHTFSSDDPSASITLTGLATSDIKIYKNGSATERASVSGYTLLDTDGIDFDSITGIHGFSIDLSDDDDSGFYAAGNEYMVAVSSITVDGATVNFVAATFSIERSGGAISLLKSATFGLSAIESLVDGVESSLATVDGKIDTIDANVDSILEDTGTTLPGTLDDIMGDTFDSSTDSLEALRNRGDSAWITATGFSTHSASDVWEVGTRTLTSLGTGSGLTAIPWNSAWDAEVQSEVTDALNAYDPPTATEMTAAFTEIKGATWSGTTDTLEAIRDRGDSAWVTATGFSTHSADDVWSVTTRELTSGANLNDLSAAQVNAQVVDALSTDAYAEPGQGAPGASISIAAKISYLYKWARNKKEADGSFTYIYDDSGSTVDQKFSTSESGGTVTIGEVESGA